MVPSSSSGREPSRKASQPRGELTSDFTRYAGLGFQLTGSVVLFGLGGWWLDTRLGTAPWLLVAGIFLGAALGFYALLKAIPPGGARSKRSGPPDDGTRPPPTR